MSGCVMSSDRESVGDLIPPDMLQVFSEGSQHGRGKRANRRAASFRRAFKWFKRQRRKTRRKAGELHGDLLATGSPVELPPANRGPEEDKVGTIALQEFNENVFVENNRPKYVLDLHTEAQQSLKLQQQEDDQNGTDYPDDQSMISTVTAQTEDSMAFSELKGFESESTTADSVSMRSSISSRSTRSGLRRQASTFRPLKPDKTTEKTKSRKKCLRTVVGIPRHVQKELGLDRAAWITTRAPNDQLFNGDVPTPAIITSVDGVSNSLEQEHLHFQLKQNLHEVEEDTTEHPLLENSHNGVPQRPMTNSADPGNLAVLENSNASVMSISPQATYLSKIIPNAVLPPSVDVVELSRGQSRSSVRTVSKSSLVSASPASTRASSRVSDYSGWSHSGSSETLVSNSSTLSSSSTPRVASRGSQVEITGRSTHLYNQNLQVPVEAVIVNGVSAQGNRKTNSVDAFTRNLSVRKPSKIAPAPPSRSYSLQRGKHNWKRTDDGSDTADLTSIDSSPYPSVISPLQMTAINQEINLKMATTSSNGLTAIPSKQIQSDKKIAHSYTNGISKLTEELRNTILSAKTLHNSSPVVMSILSLLEIPTHPKVLAPQTPPPETWAHNQRTFELLCGPGPINYSRWAKQRGLKFADEPDTALTNNGEPSNLQSLKLKAKLECLARVSSDATSPSPPPDHYPPTPDINQPIPSPQFPDCVASTRTSTTKVIKDFTSWIPPPPLFPPPAPPVGKSSATPIIVPNDEFPPPPPPFSPQSLLKMPPLPLDILPPPPPQPVPLPPNQPSEQQKTQSPPKDSLEKVAPSAISHKIMVPPIPKINDVKSQDAVIPHPTRSTEVKSQNDNVPSPPLYVGLKLQQNSVPPQTTVNKEVKSEQDDVPPSISTEEKSKHTVPPPDTVTKEVNSRNDLVAPTTVTKEVKSQRDTVLIPVPTDVKSHEDNVPQPHPLPTCIRSQEVRIPSPPPLLTDAKSLHIIVILPPPLSTEVKTEKVKRSNSPSPAKEETSGPVVTQSLLQMVRLRSVKSSQRQGVDPDKPSQLQSKSSASQEAPPKPIRRSLIMTSLPPEVEALSSTESQTESPSIAGHSKAQQESHKLETQSDNINTMSQAIASNNTSSLTKLESKQPFPEPEPDLKPQALQEPSHPSVRDPASLPSMIKSNRETQEPNKTPPISEKPSSSIGVRSKVQPKTHLEGSLPTNPSMRLQDAIRLRASAMSSKDNKVKHFGLHSPPASNSPASTASFIFAKSQKKVVIETLSSSEDQAGLRKTLVAELASVSETAKDNDVNKMATKIPPAIAKKPNGKGYSNCPTIPVSAFRSQQCLTFSFQLSSDKKIPVYCTKQYCVSSCDESK
ncbi:hypothetical protein DNTS_032863, partial [Danionella cerebrum]